MCDKEVHSIKKRKAINADISKYISNATGFRHKGFGLRSVHEVLGRRSDRL